MLMFAKCFEGKKSALLVLANFTEWHHQEVGVQFMQYSMRNASYSTSLIPQIHCRKVIGQCTSNSSFHWHGDAQEEEGAGSSYLSLLLTRQKLKLPGACWKVRVHERCAPLLCSLETSVPKSLGFSCSPDSAFWWSFSE